MYNSRRKSQRGVFNQEIKGFHIYKVNDLSVIDKSWSVLVTSIVDTI